MPHNLLRSDGGLDLSPELVLLVVEFTEYSPEQIKTFMTLSKSFRNLLLENERSITDRIANTQLSYSGPTNPLLHCCTRCESCTAKAKAHDAEARRIRQQHKRPLRPSTISETPQAGGPFYLKCHNYSWLGEQYFRNSITSTLMNNAFLAMLPSTPWHLQIPHPPQGEFADVDHTSFKRQALELMYAFADSAATSNTTPGNAREGQEEFLQSLSAPFIAILSLSVSILSNAYVVQERSTRPADPELSLILQEEQLVFEERMLRNGPFFLWAHTSGSPAAKEWVREEMRHGMQELRDFESGSGSVVGSLQSLVCRTFCRKTGCEFLDRWVEMTAVVDRLLILSMI